MTYAKRLADILTPSENRLLVRLNSPQKIQDHLDKLPINFEHEGETYMSVRRTIHAKTAHCFEGALLAAAALAYHGQKPYLMDMQTSPDDEDHVIAIFKQNGYWGAISKTNHSILRYRDPVYKNPRELALSYFHEYMKNSGKKTLRAYSAPYDLSKFSPEKWVTEVEDLVWLVDALDDSRHFPIAPDRNIALARHASVVERHALRFSEWKENGKKMF